MYKCLPLLLQSGWESLWHLTNSMTNNTIQPRALWMMMFTTVITAYRAAVRSGMRVPRFFFFSHVKKWRPLFDTRLMTYWIHPYSPIILCQSREKLISTGLLYHHGCLFVQMRLACDKRADENAANPVPFQCLVSVCGSRLKGAGGGWGLSRWQRARGVRAGGDG